MVRIRSMHRVFIAIAIIVVLTGLYLFHQQSVNSISERARENTSALNLGIVYLPVTREIADYYGLSVDSGALVTEVTRDSLVDRAGIKAGDVIISFNGVRVEEAEPLLGMMRSCPAGRIITLEVWSVNGRRLVTIMHSGQ